MTTVPANRRWFQLSLRRIFAIVTIVAMLTAWATWNWRKVSERREFVAAAGAVNGHVRTMQGYHTSFDRTSIKWLLFGDERVTFINLYPGTYNDAYLAQVRILFPEAEIASSWDPNVDGE